jgi:amino acid transporter
MLFLTLSSIQNTVQAVFGPIGGVFCAVLVGISCLGSLSANIFATGRLTVAAAEQGYLPGVLGNFGFRKINKPHENALYLIANNSEGCPGDTPEDLDVWRTPM